MEKAKAETDSYGASRSSGLNKNTRKLFETYPDVVEVDDLCKMLGGISRKLAYRLLAQQEIKSIRIGRSYKIPKVFIIEYLTCSS